MFGGAQRNKIIAIVIAIGVAAILGVGFTVVGISTRNRIGANHEAGGLEFTMALQSDVVPVGQPVNITLTVQNIGLTTISREVSEPEFDFIVNNSYNDQVYRWSFGQIFPAIAWILHFLPGETSTMTLSWPQTCQNTSTGESVQVLPGQYDIVGFCKWFGMQAGPVLVTIIS
jgi:hypothetical protein